MALPLVYRQWNIVPNVRIFGGSPVSGAVNYGITGTMQNYLYTVKQLFTLTGSYTLKGSAANGTGAMDGVDRWPTPSAILAGTADPKLAAGNTLTYPTSSIGDMAWVCLTDKAGGDILIQWWGPKADAMRVSYSPGGLFVTSSYHVSGGICPTGSDEVHFLQNTVSTVFPVGYGASNTPQQGFSDRIMNAWFAPDGKSCRFLIFGLGGAVGARWGVEQVYMTTGPGAVVWSGSWGFAHYTNLTIGTLFASYNQGNSTLCSGQAGMSIGGVYHQVQLVHGTEMYNGTAIPWSTVKLDSQGAAGYAINTIGIGGVSVGATGKFGNLIDHWFIQGTSTTIAAPGNVLGNKQFIITGNDGWFWPWDGATTPITE